MMMCMGVQRPDGTFSLLSLDESYDTGGVYCWDFYVIFQGTLRCSFFSSVLSFSSSPSPSPSSASPFPLLHLPLLFLFPISFSCLSFSSCPSSSQRLHWTKAHTHTHTQLGGQGRGRHVPLHGVELAQLFGEKGAAGGQAEERALRLGVHGGELEGGRH